MYSAHLCFPFYSCSSRCKSASPHCHLTKKSSMQVFDGMVPHGTRMVPVHGIGKHVGLPVDLASRLEEVNSNSGLSVRFLNRMKTCNDAYAQGLVSPASFGWAGGCIKVRGPRARTEAAYAWVESPWAERSTLRSLFLWSMNTYPPRPTVVRPKIQAKALAVLDPPEALKVAASSRGRVFWM